MSKELEGSRKDIGVKSKVLGVLELGVKSSGVNSWELRVRS
jgi:hypothetical protein